MSAPIAPNISPALTGIRTGAQNPSDPAVSITTVTNPDGGTIVTVYDGYGMPLSVTDPIGRITSYTYDANHDEISMTDPLGNTTTYTYDSNGFWISATDPLGDRSQATCNVFGWPLTVTDALGNVSTTTYDSVVSAYLNDRQHWPAFGTGIRFFRQHNGGDRRRWQRHTYGLRRAPRCDVKH